ncbi:MAG: YbaK/EbsC family protein [Rhodobacteraceae bacterium]|nr:YbaK/EbsC family protein [Paracoccaceae bacterium]
MSKSLKRVRAALDAAGAAADLRETAVARTAEDAARALECAVDQIAKSVVLAGTESGRAVLFVTAGGRRVDMARAADLAGEPLGKADAAAVRAQTGFAIGGVSPVGAIAPMAVFFDRTLMGFGKVWAAAGTPHHVFGAAPGEILRVSGGQLADFVMD